MTMETEEIEHEEEEVSSTFEFDGAFQRKIAALLYRDSNFAQRTDGLIKPEYFEDEVDANLVGVALDYISRFRKAPHPSILATLIKRAIDERRIRKEVIKDVKGRLKDYLRIDISDADFVADQVAEFARNKAIEKALMESVHALERRDYDRIGKTMRSALDVGLNSGLSRYNYWEEIENRTQKRIDMLAGVIKPDGITSGYPDLDKYLFHKGWGRKELTVIMGAAKAGKSMSLGDFAKNAALAGYAVIYFTLEVSREIIAERMDANVSATAMRILKDNPHKVKAAVEAASKRGGPLYLEEYPSGTLKCSQIRRVLEQYRQDGIHFDMVVVDYADIMAPERFSGDLREDMRQIYIDLRAIASIYGVAMLTATQTNREGAKKMVATMTDVAEDFNNIRTADLVISINALEEERKSGEARLYFAASRNSEGDFTLRIQQDRESMRFITKILGKE